VMNPQDTANNILVDINAESQCDLLGNPGTAPAGFHFNDGVYAFFLPTYGLPWGQDRLIPIFLATLAIRQKSSRITFNSAAEMLNAFGMQQGGSQYRRLVASFQRIFGATIFFGSDTQRERAAVVHRARFNFMAEARIWYSKDPEQKLLPRRLSEHDYLER
jgi:Replication initiator protein A